MLLMDRQKDKQTNAAKNIISFSEIIKPSCMNTLFIDVEILQIYIKAVNVLNGPTCQTINTYIRTLYCSFCGELLKC